MTSKHFAVLGDPIEHSFSPNIHAAAYKILNLDWDYSRFQVKSGTLAQFLAESGKEFSGLSVTMPLKKEAAALATTVDDIVALTGVANTLVREQDEFNAYNTDVYGITQALKECFDSSPKYVALLGAGATAISALVAIHQKAPTAEITLYVRDKSRAQDVVALSAKLKLNLVVAELSEFFSGKDLVISTIPNLALSEIKVETNRGWLLYTNYQGIDSEFTSSFENNRAVDGRMMLLWQALAQIRIFVNGSPETELPEEQAVFKAMAAAL